MNRFPTGGPLLKGFYLLHCSSATPPTIAAIIFDLDGTLVNTLNDIAAAANAALTQLNQPTHQPTDYLPMIGYGATVLLTRALPPDRPDLIPTAVEHFNTYYRAHPIDHTQLYDGIDALLNDLTAHQCPIGIYSNKPHRTVQLVADQLLTPWSWTSIVGHRDHLPPKPDPTAVQAMTATWPCPADHIAFVGDSQVDIQTARAAGMFAIAAAWGFRTADQLAETTPDILCHTPAELHRWLLDHLAI